MELDGGALDSVFAEWSSISGPGAAVGVFHGDRILFAAGYGAATLEEPRPITPTTVFRSGSIAKQFTAACIGLLALRGELDLAAPLKESFPELPAYCGDMVVRDLVHHTSGLRDFYTVRSLGGLEVYGNYDSEAVLDLMVRQTAGSFAPGSRCVYSNSNYVLLALIVKRVTGRTLRQFAQDELLDPIGMLKSHFHDDPSEYVPDRATGHQPGEAGGWEIFETPTPIVGQGNLMTTILDLAKWHSFLWLDGNPRLTNLMTTTVPLRDGTPNSYAFGLSVSTVRGQRMVGHNGATAGFRTAMMAYPDSQLTVAVLANASTANADHLLAQVVNIAIRHVGDKREPLRAHAYPESFVSRPLDEIADYATTWHSAEVGMTVELTVEDGVVTYHQPGRQFALVRDGDAFVRPEPRFSVTFCGCSGGGLCHLLVDVASTRSYLFDLTVRAGSLDLSGRRAATPAPISTPHGS